MLCGICGEHGHRWGPLLQVLYAFRRSVHSVNSWETWYSWNWFWVLPIFTPYFSLHTTFPIQTSTYALFEAVEVLNKDIKNTSIKSVIPLYMVNRIQTSIPDLIYKEIEFQNFMIQSFILWLETLSWSNMVLFDLNCKLVFRNIYIYVYTDLGSCGMR